MGGIRGPRYTHEGPREPLSYVKDEDGGTVQVRFQTVPYYKPIVRYGTVQRYGTVDFSRVRRTFTSLVLTYISQSVGFLSSMHILSVFLITTYSVQSFFFLRTNTHVVRMCFLNSRQTFL